MPAAKIYEGEWVTCENGHEIARAIRDTVYGAGGSAKDMEWTGIDTKLLKTGGQVPFCPCGMPWAMRLNGLKEFNPEGYICVATEWRPPMTPTAKAAWERLKPRPKSSL